MHFAVKPKANFMGERFPISVIPQSLTIPPHEYRFVTLRFSPRAIAEYNAEFSATVENGDGDATTHEFKCEL